MKMPKSLVGTSDRAEDFLYSPTARENEVYRPNWIKETRQLTSIAKVKITPNKAVVNGVLEEGFHLEGLRTDSPVEAARFRYNLRSEITIFMWRFVKRARVFATAGLASRLSWGTRFLFRLYNKFALFIETLNIFRLQVENIHLDPFLVMYKEQKALAKLDRQPKVFKVNK